MKSQGTNCLVWALTLVVGLCADDFTCDTGSATQGQEGEKVPTVITESNSYQARVEVNILDKNYSFVVDEYLDYPGNRARLDIYKSGNKETVIYSYATDEVFDIQSQACKIYTSATDPYGFIFGSSANGATDPDKRHVLGSASSLRFAANSSDLFKGTSTVRGVSADVWSSCIDFPGAQGKVKASYYFTPPGWNTSSPDFQIPLRIEVEGLSVSTGPGPTPAGPVTPRYFHHIYDYINYLPFIDEDPTLFETPPNVICAGRKVTKKIPRANEFFRYRTETVDPASSAVTHYSIWYDEDRKLSREDTYVATAENPTGEKVTEIHDFDTGLRYVKKSDGTCTIKPLDPNAADSQDVTSNGQFTGSVSVDMKGPNNFFMLNDNYTFTGQRVVRGINCDIFSNIVQGYVVEGVTFDATFQYAFITADYDDAPGNGFPGDSQPYPVQLVITVPDVYYTRIYNFFDYEEERTPFSYFDVSACFDDTQKIGFRLTFPGDFTPGTEDAWVTEIISLLTEIMQIGPIRVSGITITHDVYNIYVDGYVLGSAYLAQFEKATSNQQEYMDDKVVKGITQPDQCAYLCVTNPDFPCDGFQYCPNDGYACRLSKTHGGTRNLLLNATSCDDFTRTVSNQVVRQFILLKDAYTKLTNALQNGRLEAEVQKPGDVMPVPFVAVDLTTTSGQPVTTKSLPSLPTSFFYRMETVLPAMLNVVETFVWYDKDMALIRYDSRDANSMLPQMTTHIHDFTTGVAYTIDQVTEQCSVTSIPSKALFDVAASTYATAQNGSLILTMKSPYGIFFLDDSYKYIGQGTARGILCDIYESRRSDFDLANYNINNTNTVFKYYFQADSWEYYSLQGITKTLNQPVQLWIEDKTMHSSMIYNFYDFTEQHFAPEFYDTTVCYNPDERQNFIVTFKGQQFHPLLDDLSNTFLNTILLKLAEFTQLSPIRFQSASVTYDDDSVYFIATALGNVSPLTYFTPVVETTLNLKAAQSQIVALSAEDCATACMQMNSFPCNSFDYCPKGDTSSQPNCLLGALHGESEGDIVNSTGQCTHYSRSENIMYPTITIDMLYKKIVDYVYDDKFIIPLTLLNGTKVNYIATDIRNDIFLPTDPGSSPGNSLKQFVITPGYHLNDSKVSVTHDIVSIIDCSELCLKENTFDCEVFDYQFTTGRCRLSSIHPDEDGSGRTGFAKDQYSNIYTKLYTDDYHQYSAQAFKTPADKTLQNVQSDEMCARACTQITDFECESFEICNDGSCLLHKTHILSAATGDLTQNADCTHYSRNHLFDYIERKEKLLEGHDDSQAQVQDAEECAQLCSNGDGLPSCASFEICEKQRGEMICTFSTADPTVQKDLTIVNSLQCSLFTKANPSSLTNPTVHGQTNTPGRNTVTTTTTTTRKPAVTAQPTIAQGTVKQPTNTGSGTVSQTCGGDSQSSSTSDSDTGARVGIAFGTLILGLIVGAVSTVLVMRWRLRGPNREDVHIIMLKTLSNN